jgi:predicted CXXCH cytochrome family protein
MGRFTHFLLIAIAALPLFAGDWHYGAHIVCSDCHTQHNSEGTPARALLLRATPLELCLSCHDGSNPDAQDVVMPVASESAAGAFPNSGGIPTTNAHHLNNPSAEVPPGGTVPMVLTCTTCHDPHGNTNYRNLRGIAPAVINTTRVAGTVIYKSGVSAWCGQCHGAPTHHSVDKTISGTAIADYTRWTSVTLPRVPVESPADDTIPSTDDQVTCLSCHKAHGSDNTAATIYADGNSIDSTCGECHDAAASPATIHARTTCVQCHDQHKPADGSNEGCFVCHGAAMAEWTQSAHAARQCVDCHDPHGAKDAGQEQLCAGCHRGSYAHGASAFANRRADCGDCHNLHAAGVSRVQVANGGAGVTPAYRLAAASDPGEIHEYEICFKCHSSFTKQPLGQSDLARLTNPANASFHPIQSEGKNARIDPQTFVNGFDANSRITCSDCHASDDPNVRGPHASSHRYLLKKSQDDICFECHARGVYADPLAPSEVARAGRFNGHALHAAQKIACFACHDAHGSVRNPGLIVTGRVPGITTFIPTPNGGTCTTNCHGLQSYTASDRR